MRILIEEYRYDVTKVKDILYGIDALENVDGEVSIHYVGYYYNSLLKDCVFILPKVLLKDVDGKELVFCKYSPEDIANLSENNPLEADERAFIYKFVVWIYRAIVVYKNDCRNDSDIVYYMRIMQVGKGGRRICNTYLDILLQLLQFNRDNQSFFFYVLKNIHAGFNKINWTRTISRETAIVQNEQPIYLKPVNKKRQINFDEELIVIFFSILNYIGDTYGFPKDIKFQFPLIKGAQFKTYLSGLGCTRLRQIKYKYFSDKALELWNLCYAFFDEASKVYVNIDKKEYLLVKSFYIVFEAMIDELIGDNPLPDGMDKKQEDGKIVDHLFTAKSLIEGEAGQTYYIGDSKYYKIGHELGDESIYKQYTYARNVIQWNLDIFNGGDETSSGVRLRDDVTEGYNIIPNFFVSAKIDEKVTEEGIRRFDYGDDGIEKTDRQHKRHRKLQFENRLFDRDTLLLFHYDVNFLFVLSLYARNNQSQKAEWKQKVRNRFRNEIRAWLEDAYDFYAMSAKPGVDAKRYFKTHFQDVLGKTYTPFADSGIYSLALDHAEKYRKSNDALIAELRKHFIVEPCRLGVNPQTVIGAARVAGGVAVSPEKDGVLMVMMENYDTKSPHFLTSGRIAVGIKYNKESMEIVEHLTTIGHILFHHRSNEELHLFAVKGCRMVAKDDLDAGTYRNNKTDDVTIYVVVEMDTSAEFDASALNVKNAEFTKKTRYDAQFSTMDALLTPMLTPDMAETD